MASGDRPHAKPGVRQVVASVDRTGPRPPLVIAERGRDEASVGAGVVDPVAPRVPVMPSRERVETVDPVRRATGGVESKRPPPVAVGV